MSHFELYPAIDVRGGRVVRLRQGDYAQETRYPADPFELAQEYARSGARWLHLVDLDAARSGGYSLDALLARIAAETPLHVQTGGGVRNEADVERLLAAGAARVVVGSLAVRMPERVAFWLERYGAERLVLALDTRQDEAGTWRLPLHGWTEASGRNLGDVLSHYVASGLRHVLSTDIARDGMLAGPNLELYRHLRRLAPWLQVQASGGVRDAADVAAVRSAGCAGVVLGRALLEGRLVLAEALAC
jgi:phosphoribosylformimino-5-aminoimidazole carboxamide ribotide isomerase